MRKIIITVFFLTFISLEFVQADIVMTPYLQAVTKSSIYVLVECSTQDTVTVMYGLTSSYGSSAKTESIENTAASPVTYVHNVKLSGLQTNTFYYYKAVQGSSSSQGFSFRTAVDTGTSFRFVCMGDCRSGTSIHDQIAQRIFSANPIVLIYSGDLCYDSTYNYWKSEFFRTNELNLIAQVPFFNAPGNHESWKTNTQAFTQAPGSASGTQAYYSFDYGDMHVLIINNEVPYNVGSAQYNFALSDLASTTKQWKIVNSHHPAYCAGGHGEDTTMIAMTQNIFVPNHVDMVISGHSHFYQHNYVNNIHHMVIGTAGAPLYDPLIANYTLKSVKDYCYAVTDVTPTTFTMLVYNNVGTLLDSIRLVKTTSGMHNMNKNLDEFNLNQNYPNPFNPGTDINFHIAKKGFTTLKIYNLLGNEILTLISSDLEPGDYHIKWDGSGYPSGTYFYRLQNEYFNESKKMVLVK